MKLALLGILLFISLTLILPSPDGYRKIPIVYASGLPFVQLSINGKEAIFMMDTGCSISCVDSSDSKYYGFNSTERWGTINGIGGSVSSYYVDNYTIGLGDNMINVGFITMNMNNGFFDGYGFDVAGTIGLDVLTKYNAKIDLENNILYIPK